MKIAVVEWWPRICGATDWAIHLSHAAAPRGVTLDRLTFSKSGRTLAAWDRPELWQVHRQSDAVDVLNAYDLVIPSDVVSFAPALVDRGRSVPYYVDVLGRLKTPWTSMYHGGTYPSKYDDTLRAVFRTKSFTGKLITTRLPEAHARLDHLVPRPIRYLNYPYLPYSTAYRPTPKQHAPLHRRRRDAILMTARIAVNKGQNVMLYLGPRAAMNVRLFGYNAFGLPSIGWRLWELANALKYKVLKKPGLRTDVGHLTHPRANRFYTGPFAVSENGFETSYHDGYLSLDDIDWSLAAVHLSLPSEDFRGTLEYVTLDAVNAGAVAVVPEHNVAYPRYATGAFPTVRFTRASIWSREDGTPKLKYDTEEAASIVATLTRLRRASVGELGRIAAAQRRELETKHDPAVVLKKLLKHVEGDVHESSRADIQRPAPGRPGHGVQGSIRRSRKRGEPGEQVSPPAGARRLDAGAAPRRDAALVEGPERVRRLPHRSANEGGNVKRGKLKAIGSNIFAGGFTVGVSKHFDVVAHLEHDDYGVEVAKKNFPNLPIFVGTDTWPDSLPPGKQLDFLYSNPPCAIWSLAGNRDGRVDWRKDPRLQRIRDIHGLIAKYRPAVWCWESVCQAFERGREFVEALADAAKDLGYSASYVLIDAQYFRAPQTRKRFFLVLHRIAIDWPAARPSFSEEDQVTIGDVLKGVKPDKFRSRISDTPIGKQLKRLVEMTEPGGRLAKTYEDNAAKMLKGVSEKKKNFGKPSFLAYRINPDSVSGVVFGDKTFHHKEPRHLALNELGAIHGFPPDYDWVGEHHRLDPQRGVLPPVAEWLARNVAAAVRRDVAVKKPTRTLVDFRRAPGNIQDVFALPASVDLDWKPGETAEAAADRRGPTRRDDEPLDAGARVVVREPGHKFAGVAGTVRTANARLLTIDLDNGRTAAVAPDGVAPGPEIPDKKSRVSAAGDGSRGVAGRGGLHKASKAAAGAPGTGVRASPAGGGARGAGSGRRAPDGTRPSRDPWVDAKGRAWTSGEFIRARLLEKRWTDEEIVSQVLGKFAGRKTTTHDVAWNRRKIELDGGPILERLDR